MDQAQDNEHSWQTHQFIPYERGLTWYVSMICVFAVLIILGLITDNLLFIFALSLGIGLYYLSQLRSQKTVLILVNEQGIKLGETFTAWKEIESYNTFSLGSDLVVILHHARSPLHSLTFHVPAEEKAASEKVLKRYVYQPLPQKEVMIDKLLHYLKI